MSSFLKKNIVLLLFIVFLIAGITGCKPKVSPVGRDFLTKVSRDISALAADIKTTMHTKDASNAVEVICNWAEKIAGPTNQYLAVALIDSTGTDYFSYDLIKCEGIVSEGDAGDYSKYKAMQPLIKGKTFATGIVHWESIPYGVVGRIVESGSTNCGVVVLFISTDSIKNSDITIDQFSNNVL